ncbi:MAG: cytochrome ubiquinol oxidase subunit I [Phycisphaerales bacterium]|nr:cytochrome ubiquinol oxidase subunit I [Phycisphaerales bacterium]
MPPADPIATTGDILLDAGNNELEVLVFQLGAGWFGVDRASKRFILAEDSPFMRVQMRKAFLTSGYDRLEVYSDGLDAWEAIQRSDDTTDCVVSDIEMPRMDGLRLCKLIRESERWSDTPVVLFSSLITGDNLKKGKQVGADVQVAKPDMDEMIQLVNHIVVGVPIAESDVMKRLANSPKPHNPRGPSRSVCACYHRRTPTLSCEVPMDVELLSRLQFAGTVMFHYLFPPLTIGLGLILVIMEGMYLKTRDPVLERAVKFWVRIFALNFAFGVATGIVMEFEFGTNWAAYSRFVGDVFGSPLAAEAIFAFFLESTFLAILVFGWNRVGPKMHFFSTIMVSLGSILSALWIIIANSWQQTPAGHHIVDMEVNGRIVQRAEVVDFWAVVFNPSTIDRVAHTVIGAFILGGFFVMSISAYYVLKNRHLDFAKRSLAVGLGLALVASIAVLMTGHHQAITVAQTQPAKLAAFEGHFETGEGGADLYIIGWPDEESKTVKAGVKIPGMLSVLVHGDSSTPVPGLDQTPEDEQPPVWLSFQSYHLMVGLGMYFIGITIVTLIFRVTGRLWRTRWLLWILVASVILPFAANEAGWVAAEVGRQPWIVYPVVEDGVTIERGLKVSEALSEAVSAGQVLWSIVMFGAIYLMMFVIWLALMNAKIRRGPEEMEPTDAPGMSSPYAVSQGGGS